MARKAFDIRLLSHYPQGQRCLDTCLSNGWLPGNGDILRLVRLWDEVDQGVRSEQTEINPVRLRFARWLVQQGRISDEINPGPSPERR